MKDLGDRFAQSEEGHKAELPPNPLVRLQQASSDDLAGQGSSSPRSLLDFYGRSDLLTALCATTAAVLVLWSLLQPTVSQLPAVVETGDEVAVLAVRPLTHDEVLSPPDWYDLFNAYQLETGLRDISIRCNYGLPADAPIDRYLHAHLALGTEVRIFLADPGKCPKS